MPKAVTRQPISLLLCALGGEGGGVLKDWLVDVAHRAGHAAQATSVPGVAQRTGATTYYVEIHPDPVLATAGRRPVFGLTPLPGQLDVLVASELLEAARQVVQGMATAERTLVIAATNRALTVAEKMNMGDGRRPADELRTIIEQNSRAHHFLDMADLSRQAQTVISAVMLGTLAGCGALPFSRQDYEAVIGGDTPSKQASLRGFALGFEAMQVQQQRTDWVQSIIAPALHPAAEVDDDGDLGDFPAVALPVIALGCARLKDYQSRRYAQLYLDRLRAVWTAEQAAQAPADGQLGKVTSEMARWLALWMAFDDVVRVADLKSRRQRWQRVTREVKAGPDDLLKVFDHFKPGIAELAGLLPKSLAQPLLRWDHRRVQRGHQPWALPLRIGTHSILGMLALRAMAAMRRLRPFSSRFLTEQALIERWWRAVIDACREDGGLAHELAQCGRLIKGYGATNERGKANLLHIIDHLAVAEGQTSAQRAQAVAAARVAALQDDAGQALDAALRQHGAPPRAVREQPIRWVRKPANSAASAPRIG